MSSQPYDPSQQQQQIYPYNYNHQQFQPLSDPYQPQQYYHNQTQSSSSSSYPPPYHTPAGSNTNYGVEDSSIHPPGVPLHESNVSIASSDAQNQHNSYYYYYPNAPIAEMPQNNQTHVQITQIIEASNAVANGVGHSYSAVSGQGHYGSAHGQTHAIPLIQGAAPIPVPTSQLIQPSYGSTPSIPNKRVKAKGRKVKPQQPRQSAWCELCKVDCNSLEIFEQHKNGKKHQKNLKLQKGPQMLNEVMVEGQTATEHKPEIPSQFANVEESKDKQLPLETLSSVSAITGEQKAVEAGGTAEPTTKKRKKKSKTKSGKGVKFVKSDDGSKVPVEAPKPQVIPLICELCNVTCESPVVFQAHLTGKKHLANLKRFQSEQELLGQAAVQALYPALQALYPAIQALCQGDMSSLVSILQQQGFLGVQAQPGPSNYFQGQGSEVPPATATLTAIGHPSALPEQQSDTPPTALETAAASQVVSLTEDKSDEQPLSEIAHPSALPEQQSDTPPTALETAAASQVVSLTEGKSDEQPIPAPEVIKDAESEVVEGK